MDRSPELRADVLSAQCPSRAMMNHVTSKWGVLVLLALHSETLRFSDLRRRIQGVSERMLSQTLKLLEEDGIVSRRAFEVVPPHVEYSLTDFGKGAAQRLAALALFIENSFDASQAQNGNPM